MFTVAACRKAHLASIQCSARLVQNRARNHPYGLPASEGGMYHIPDLMLTIERRGCTQRLTIDNRSKCYIIKPFIPSPPSFCLAIVQRIACEEITVQHRWMSPVNCDRNGTIMGNKAICAKDGTDEKYIAFQYATNLRKGVPNALKWGDMDRSNRQSHLMYRVYQNVTRFVWQRILISLHRTPPSFCPLFLSRYLII